MCRVCARFPIQIVRPRTLLPTPELFTSFCRKALLCGRTRMEIKRKNSRSDWYVILMTSVQRSDTHVRVKEEKNNIVFCGKKKKRKIKCSDGHFWRGGVVFVNQSSERASNIFSVSFDQHWWSQIAELFKKVNWPAN